MAVAALRPAPMARMTVAAPVTMSPPANTPSRLVAPVGVSATMQPWLLTSRPLVRLRDERVRVRAEGDDDEVGLHRELRAGYFDGAAAA